MLRVDGAVFRMIRYSDGPFYDANLCSLRESSNAATLQGRTAKQPWKFNNTYRSNRTQSSEIVGKGMCARAPSARQCSPFEVHVAQGSGALSVSSEVFQSLMWPLLSATRTARLWSGKKLRFRTETRCWSVIAFVCASSTGKFLRAASVSTSFSEQAYDVCASVTF